jgi:hypothetical protein
MPDIVIAIFSRFFFFNSSMHLFVNQIPLVKRKKKERKREEEKK